MHEPITLLIRYRSFKGIARIRSLLIEGIIAAKGYVPIKIIKDSLKEISTAEAWRRICHRLDISNVKINVKMKAIPSVNTLIFSNIWTIEKKSIRENNKANIPTVTSNKMINFLEFEEIL